MTEYRQKRELVRKAIAAAAFIVLLAGCAKNDPQKQARGLVHFGSSAGENGILLGVAGVAREQGYIQEELNAVGYDVEFFGFVNGVAVNEAFAAKELEISTLGDVPAAIGFSNNIGTVWIGLGLSSYNSEILARTDTGITSVKDLEGKKVAYGVGTTTEYLWQQVVREYGLDESKVEKVNLSGAHLINAIETKDVDAIIHGENWTRQLEVQGKGTIILTTADHPQWKPQDTVVGRDAYLKEHPEVGVAVLKALIRARETVTANPDPHYVTISGRQLEQFPDLARNIYNRDNKNSGNFAILDSHIYDDNIAREQALADFLESVDKIVNHVVIKAHVDTSYWEKASVELKNQE
jgi:sulfonate transport system substrate-binding protein